MSYIKIVSVFAIVTLVTLTGFYLNLNNNLQREKVTYKAETTWEDIKELENGTEKDKDYVVQYHTGVTSTVSRLKYKGDAKEAIIDSLNGFKYLDKAKIDEIIRGYMTQFNRRQEDVGMEVTINVEPLEFKVVQQCITVLSSSEGETVKFKSREVRDIFIE